MSALRVFLATIVATVCGVAGWSGLSTFAAVTDQPDALSGAPHHKRGFEVWIADQSDTRPGHGGQILIYEGSRLYGRHPEQARPSARLDLGDAAAQLCMAATGRNPVRPHMIQFNSEYTHAVVSFVASGHVVIFDAERRKPLQCFETTVGSTGTRQAHAAFPAPDGSYILVANQNGKRLERIDTDFATNRFAHNPAATLDLATCTTPGGQPCEHPDLRPDQLADLPDHRRQQQLRLRDAARRRAVRGRRQDHADVDRRRVRQGDGARQRLRRDRGRRAHVHQLGREPGERVGRQPAPSRSVRVRRLPVPEDRLLAVQPAEQPGAVAAADQDRDVRLPRGGVHREALVGDGSPRQRRRDPRRALGRVGQHCGSRPAGSAATRRPTWWIGRRPATGCSSRCAARCRSAAIRTTRPAVRPASASSR